MKITILTDNKKSWVLPYVKTIHNKLSKDHAVSHVYNIRDVEESDVLFILSCEKIVTKKQLNICKNNIVIHPSELPKGRGWSPVAWQILEDKNFIPMSLFEAEAAVDSGDIYIVDYIELQGTELNEEIKHLQGIKTVEMAIAYISKWPMVGKPQEDYESTYYKRRGLDSSELDINKSIEENFNLLRVVDNNRYPAFFYKDGVKYIIKIYNK
jgi:methionyl-tRNA formyltransferase|tara:strand:+ start:370 stop:1002 length:633 start_codon:yes stop_codon:yes gene_type:complete